MSITTLTHGDNKDCPKVRDGLWSRCEGHEVDDEQALIHVFRPIGGAYKIQDRADAVNSARGIENAAKAVKNDLRSGQTRDALRHSMQLAQSLVELQHWLLRHQS